MLSQVTPWLHRPPVPSPGRSPKRHVPQLKSFSPRRVVSVFRVEQAVVKGLPGAALHVRRCALSQTLSCSSIKRHADILKPCLVPFCHGPFRLLRSLLFLFSFYSRLEGLMDSLWAALTPTIGTRLAATPAARPLCGLCLLSSGCSLPHTFRP